MIRVHSFNRPFLDFYIGIKDFISLFRISCSRFFRFEYFGQVRALRIAFSTIKFPYPADSGTSLHLSYYQVLVSDSFEHFASPFLLSSSRIQPIQALRFAFPTIKFPLPADSGTSLHLSYYQVLVSSGFGHFASPFQLSSSRFRPVRALRFTFPTIKFPHLLLHSIPIMAEIVKNNFSTSHSYQKEHATFPNTVACSYPTIYK
ncbi:hypothetical protein B4102_3232 [Heyndrickxia sporothermodurans]|uniref:Uncharacterized protein n=1 Tax=Heyndrickxia sporothermodurans TaxID=46224 RepID=A0A150KZJ8_9BACI|nr:hypothetical protein B4102_3232 [Heyndrickxia sporothermodurans]